MVRSRIVLATRGRRTGEPRRATLYAFEDGSSGRLVVVASKGGATKDPHWATNLRAEPAATVRSGKREWPVTAHEAEADERDRLWALVTKESSFYAGFQRRTKRVIPVFVLTPVSE